MTKIFDFDLHPTARLLDCAVLASTRMPLRAGLRQRFDPRDKQNTFYSIYPQLQRLLKDGRSGIGVQR